MKIELEDVIERLKSHDKFLIIAHKSPDGDTLGSAYALYSALKAIGKQAKVKCSDSIPERLKYLALDYKSSDFEPKYIVAVDVAATQLIGEKLEKYIGKINLCIDHHPSNELYAKETYLVSTASAACEIIFDIIVKLKVEITKQMANCIYTGICTDSGCFKYSNTTAKTHSIAAELFNAGAEYEWINRSLFETKSKSRILIEQQALNSIEYFYNDKVAVIGITKDMISQIGADESELDGVSAIPRTIEGVEVGITIRERSENVHKISVRTTNLFDASKLCEQFNGGGHKRAAGCVVEADYNTTKKMIVEAIRPLMAETQEVEIIEE